MSQNSRMQRVLETIGEQVARGFLASAVVEGLHKAYRVGRITSGRYFFAESYYSCLDIAVLCFSRLMSKDKSSVTVAYLLNCAEQESESFPYAGKQTVLDAISTHRQWLQTLKPLGCTVRLQRNWTLAHIDKRHVNNPSLIESLPAIPIDQVIGAFPRFLEIINTYKGYLSDSELSLKVLEQETARDVDYLLDLIEQDNKRKSTLLLTNRPPLL